MRSPTSVSVRPARRKSKPRRSKRIGREDERFGPEWSDQIRRFVLDASELTAKEFLLLSTSPKNRNRALALFRIIARAYADLLLRCARLVGMLGVDMVLALREAGLRSLGRRRRG
jgi:hypothetical protein